MNKTKEQTVRVLKAIQIKKKASKNEYIKSIYDDMFTAIASIYKAIQEDEQELNTFKTIQEYNNRMRESVIAKSCVVSTKIATETAIKNNDTNAIRKILDSIAIDLLHIHKLENNGARENNLRF